MYELVQVAAHSYYIDCPAKIGVYAADPEKVYLIDSGNDKDAGRKVRQILDREGWKLAGILNTHSNADHIGGNHYLQAQTGCAVFAGGMESDFTRHPVLEPSLLYGGFPYAELRNKFLLAQESEVRPFSDPAYPAHMKPIPLPGHFLDMVGFRTPDDAVYLADCLASEVTLAKYGIPFIYDVASYLATLEMVEHLPGAIFIPAHAPATDDVAPLARLNREKTLETAERLFNACHEPATFETLLKALMDGYNLSMNHAQYVLVGSTVRSFLAWLKDAGRVTVEFVDNRMLWQSV